MNLLQIIQNGVRNYLHLYITKSQSGAGPTEIRYTYQQKLIDFKIKPGDTVLDVGSGQDPFPLATHLADLYVNDTNHRRHIKLVQDDRPFTQCSVDDMPFQDKQFNFVYACHVLEHVPDPGKACRELMRVAKRGYIETPTRTSDVMMNYLPIKDHHRWHISLILNTLVFMEYTDQEKNHDLGTGYFFNELHSKYKNPFQDMFNGNMNIFYNMFLWDTAFSFYVFDKTGQLIDHS